MVLLCAAAGEKTVDEFASNEAIQCTEIYEFVQKLGNQEYEMPTLQVGEEKVDEKKLKGHILLTVSQIPPFLKSVKGKERGKRSNFSFIFPPFFL